MYCAPFLQSTRKSGKSGLSEVAWVWTIIMWLKPLFARTLKNVKSGFRKWLEDLPIRQHNKTHQCHHRMQEIVVGLIRVNPPGSPGKHRSMPWNRKSCLPRPRWPVRQRGRYSSWNQEVVSMTSWPWCPTTSWQHTGGDEIGLWTRLWSFLAEPLPHISLLQRPTCGSSHPGQVAAGAKKSTDGCILAWRAWSCNAGSKPEQKWSRA